jgi:hypothetical protein
LRDSLSDTASSDNWDDGEDKDEEIERGNLSKDDEPGWVMGTITHTVPQGMKWFP